MRRKRFPKVILALISACALAVALLLVIPAFAQQAPQTPVNHTADSVPISFVLGSAIDAHEQDIRDRMFEYEFEAARGDPSAQVALVEERSGELKSDAARKKGMLKALLARNGSVPPGQLAALADEMGASIEKLSGQSKKLEEHAAGLAMLNGQETYTDSVEPLISDLNDALDLASSVSQAAKDKKNDNAGPKDNQGQGDKGGPKK